MTSCAEQKEALRKTMRARRRALPFHERAICSQKLIEKMKGSTLFTPDIHNIALYMNFDGEPDLTPLADFLQQQKKSLYLPVLHPFKQVLWFLPFSPTLHANQYGIPEPVIDIHHIKAPWELDLVMVPLVAFDATHRRLGMGKGFYDQSFAFLKNVPLAWPKLIGIAYDFQEVPVVPSEPHDLILDEIFALSP